VTEGFDRPNKPAASPRVVKRYANRKLYDTRESRYVTLQQIADLVRSGEDVQIIDNTTKENVTNVALAQILYEEQKGQEREPRPSLGMLRNLVQKGGEKLMTSLREGPMGKLVARRDTDEHERTERSGRKEGDSPDAPADVEESLSLTALGRQIQGLRAELAQVRLRLAVLEGKGSRRARASQK